MNDPIALETDASSLLGERIGSVRTVRPRQLVLLLDGTNNTLTGRVRDTNVLKLYEHLFHCSEAGQILYYDPGVGSPDFLPSMGILDQASRWIQRIYGLAYGRGIHENIRDAYLFLMRNWQPGDEIWLFGFSRGAFTARSVSGMVHLFGIIDSQHESLLPTLLRVYFSKSQKIQTKSRSSVPPPAIKSSEHMKFSRGDVARQLRESFSSGERRDAWVKFVGVWDTVESVGLPIFGVQISSNPTITDKRIAHVRHALALDELRLTFRPRVYDQPNGGSAGTAQSMHQRWFRGVHSDVGGGYIHREAGLSDKAFEWMVTEARDCELRCSSVKRSRASRQIHDAVHAVPWWALAGLTIRLPKWKADHATVKEDESVELDRAPASVWGQRPGASRLIQLLLAALFVGVGYALQVMALSENWSQPGWQLPLDLAVAQLTLLSSPGTALQASLGGPSFKGSIGWSVVADTLVFLPSYSFVIAWLSGWAYRRAVGLRRATEARPPWHWLGLSPLTMVVGDVCENLLTLCVKDWTGSLNFPQMIIQCLNGVASTAKLAGLAGCIFLVFLAIANKLGRSMKRDGQMRRSSPSDGP